MVDAAMINLQQNVKSFTAIRCGSAHGQTLPHQKICYVLTDRDCTILDGFK